MNIYVYVCVYVYIMYEQTHKVTYTLLCFLFFSFFFQDRVSLGNLGCPGTHSVDQGGLELTENIQFLRRCPTLDVWDADVRQVIVLSISFPFTDRLYRLMKFFAYLLKTLVLRASVFVILFFFHLFISWQC